MSTLGQQRTADMVTTRRLLPRGTLGHHFGWSGCREQIRPPRQCKWNWLNACGCNELPSDTHGTPRSNRWDRRSLRVSSAGQHVTWRNTQHMGRRDREFSSQKDYMCWLHIQRHKRMSLTETRPCTCRTLAHLVGRCILLLHQYGCNGYLQQNLNMNKTLQYLTNPAQKINELIDWLVLGWRAGHSVVRHFRRIWNRYLPPGPRAKHFPLQPDLTQKKSIYVIGDENAYGS